MSIDKLEPGMEVAVDVMNVNNMLLISKGTLLVARHIRLLKTWGVESVGIVNVAGSQAAPAGAEIPADILREAEAAVNERFIRITVMTEMMRTIKGFAINRAAQRLFRQSQAPQSKNVK